MHTSRRIPKPAVVEDPGGLGWHVSVGINFQAHNLDNRRHWQRQGMNPDEHIAKLRQCGDDEGTRRGLMFIGEIRKGQEIQRQYVVPTFWWRLRFLYGLLKPRIEQPRKETR